MKKMKKLLALLLALVLVFSLVACGGNSSSKNDDDDDDESSSNVDKKDDKEDEKKEEEKKEEIKLADKELIIGEWSCSVNLSKLFGEMLAAELGDETLVPNSAINMNFGFKFDNKQVTIVAEIDKASFDGYVKDLCKKATDYLYNMAESNGMSKADFEKAIKDQYGMSVEAYVEKEMNKSLEKSLDLEAMTFESEANYYRVDAEKGRIYVAEDADELANSKEYMEYSLTDKELTVKKLVEEDGEETDISDFEQLGLELPWKLKKK